MNTKAGISGLLLATGLLVGSIGIAGAQASSLPGILVVNSDWNASGGIPGASGNITSTLVGGTSPTNYSPGSGVNFGTGSIGPNSMPTGVFNGTATNGASGTQDGNVDLNFVYYSGTYGNDMQATGYLSGKGTITFTSLSEIASDVSAPSWVTHVGGAAQSTSTYVIDPYDGQEALALTLNEGNGMGGSTDTLYLDEADSPTYNGTTLINSPTVAGSLAPTPEFGSCAGLATMLTGGGLFRLLVRRRNRK